MDVKIDKHIEMVLEFIGQVVPADKRMFVVESLGNFAYSLWGSARGECAEEPVEYQMVYDADIEGDDPVVKAQQRPYRKPSDEEAEAIARLRAGGTFGSAPAVAVGVPSYEATPVHDHDHDFKDDTEEDV